jgi:excisionase family DNA binding protein
MNPKDSMTMEEVAQILRTTPDKVEPLLRSGEIPATLVDGQWQISRTGFEGWKLNTAGLGTVLRSWSGPVPKASGSLGLEEASKLLNLAPDKVEALARRGVLQATQSQGGWSFTRGALEAYQQRNAGGGAVPQSWQSSKKAAPAAPQSAPPQFGAAGAERRGVPSPKLVNEPIMTTPASLELDLSILDRLEIPEPEDAEDSEET